MQNEHVILSLLNLFMLKIDFFAVNNYECNFNNTK